MKEELEAGKRREGKTNKFLKEWKGGVTFDKSRRIKHFLKHLTRDCRVINTIFRSQFLEGIVEFYTLWDHTRSLGIWITHRGGGRRREGGDKPLLLPSIGKGKGGREERQANSFIRIPFFHPRRLGKEFPCLSPTGEEKNIRRYCGRAMKEAFRRRLFNYS